MKIRAYLIFFFPAFFLDEQAVASALSLDEQAVAPAPWSDEQAIVAQLEMLRNKIHQSQNTFRT
jgi:hypothetical protein